ncbi:MAG: hypothetical protein LAT82_06075 [Nanoarchaeota archaeon]|nr:hypothetical protein [Nanoarchaeota archaeon]
MESQEFKLDYILKEIKLLRKEVKSLKKLREEEDLDSFVELLKKNNELGTEEDLKKIGINI